MGDWPVGLSTGCFYQTSIFDCLEPVRNSGFNMIEVCSFRAHLDYRKKTTVKRAAKLLRELGMEAYSFHAPFEDGIDISSPDRLERDSSVHEVLRAVEAASSLGVKHVVIHPGPDKSMDLTPADRLRRMQHAGTSLSKVASECKEQGMQLMLENVLPHLVFGAASDLLWILAAIDDSAVGICLDTGHALLGGQFSHLLDYVRGHVGMVHANDNRGQRDDHLPPGTGHVDWEHLGTALEAANFRGAMILELAGEPAEPEAVLRRAGQARLFLRGL